MIFSVLLASCADSATKNTANRAYVLSAQKVSKAEKAFDNADYVEALKLCIQAQSDVDKIVVDFPDSDVAFKLVSDSSMYIGSCKYLDLKERIIPQLELLNTPQIQPISYAWAIAIKNGEYVELAKSIIKNLNRFDSKTVDSMFNNVLLQIKNPSISESLRTQYRLARLGVGAKKTNVQKVEKTEQNVPKISDASAFLRDATTSASLVSYDVRNVSKLCDMAKMVRGADKQIVDKFTSELSKAYDNILKISTPSLREKALSEIAIAFANMGDDLRAIAISQKITNGELFYNVFKKIAESACKGDNYQSALTLASRLSDPMEKSKFLSSLAVGVAKKGLFKEACGIASTVQNILDRNLAYSQSAKLAFDAGKLAEASECISKINATNLDCLSVFCQAEGLSVRSATAMRLAVVANKLIEVNPKLATALNSMAMLELSRESGKLDEKVISTIFDNLVKIGKESEAFEFFVSRLGQFSPNSFAERLCVLAESTKDKDFSLKIYKKLGELASVREISVMELALNISLSGIARENAVKILGDVLPKFK